MSQSIQNALLLGICAHSQSSQIISQFVTTCNQSLCCNAAYVYGFETDINNNLNPEKRIINLLEHQTISKNIATSRPETKKVKHIINKCLANKSNQIAIFHTPHYFGFLLSESKQLIVLENTNHYTSRQIHKYLNPVIPKLDSLCNVISSLNQSIESTQLNIDTLNFEQDKLDALTQLPNRRQFKYILLKVLSSASRQNYYGAILYINIDNFKFINNALGHSLGDLVITKIAQRLKELCRPGDYLFRMGGDEFVFILNHLDNQFAAAKATTQTITKKLITQADRPFKLGKQDLHITSSIGIRMFPSNNLIDNDSEGILKQANMAMYDTKKKGKNDFTFYHQDLQLIANQHLIIYNQLTTALKKSEFSLAYQPFVDITGNIIGAEALIRWNSSTIGFLPPTEFIQLAEESNLIIEIGDWILKTAFQFVKKIKSSKRVSHQFEYISINISPKQLTHPGFINAINKRIAEAGINPEDIRLEFTENFLVNDIDSTILVMQELNRNNIKFLLDDFGTGYSSLAYLNRLPISAIKIDKSFVSSDADESPENKLIIDTIIAMSENMHLKCIVEGVETEKSANYFIGKKVHAIQGFYYYKPMPDNELLAVLEKSHDTAS